MKTWRSVCEISIGDRLDQTEWTPEGWAEEILELLWIALEQAPRNCTVTVKTISLEKEEEAISAEVS